MCAMVDIRIDRIKYCENQDQGGMQLLTAWALMGFCQRAGLSSFIWLVNRPLELRQPPSSLACLNHAICLCGISTALSSYATSKYTGAQLL